MYIYDFTTYPLPTVINVVVSIFDLLYTRATSSILRVINISITYRFVGLCR